MKKQSAKQVSIVELKNIHSTLEDLVEALEIFAENESSAQALQCAKKIKKLAQASKVVLADLKKIKS